MKYLAMIIVLPLTLVLFQNCGKGFDVAQTAVSQSQSLSSNLLSCPVGQHANSTTTACDPDMVAGCNPGFHFEGAACVADPVPGFRDLSTDATKFFGVSRCAQSGLEICEDFESGQISNIWTKQGGNAVVVDTVQAARGTKALHLTKTANGGQVGIRTTKPFPALNDTYYGRAFVYFQSLPTVAGPGFVHWTIAGATGLNVAGEIRVGGFFTNQKNIFGIGTDGGPTGDWTNTGDTVMPAKKWMCLEWMHKGDTNETRFWKDGVEDPKLYTNKTTAHGGNPSVPYTLPDFREVWIGWVNYQQSPETVELFIDEIGLDPKRIGCVL